MTDGDQSKLPKKSNQCKTKSRDEGPVWELYNLKMSCGFAIPETRLRISVRRIRISVSLAEFPVLKKWPAHSCFPYNRLAIANYLELDVSVTKVNM